MPSQVPNRLRSLPYPRRPERDREVQVGPVQVQEEASDRAGVQSLGAVGECKVRSATEELLARDAALE